MKALFTAPLPTLATAPAGAFFVRLVPLLAGEGVPSPAEQIELALETISPFPVAQLYYGFHCLPGGAQAVVYAAYRRRLASDLVGAWEASEWVAPAFALWLTRPGQAAETVMWQGDDCLVAWHYGQGTHEPTALLSRPLAPEATPEEKEAARDALLREIGESKVISEVKGVPQVTTVSAKGAWTLDAEGKTWSVPAEVLEGMDVRDKDTLRQLRRQRATDVLLWRTFIGAIGVVAACLLLLGALKGGLAWQATRQARIERKAPEVAAVNQANALATRIEELATRRLMPFEMIDVVKEKKPKTLVFRSTTTQGAASMEIVGTASGSGDLPAYRAALLTQPGIAEAEVVENEARDGVTRFRLVVTFKPEAFGKGGAQ